MNISQLRYFNALEVSKSYTKAAEMSFISQPALSIAIRKMEAELGVPLFEKRGANVVLTNAGSQIAPMVNRVLSDVDCIYREAAYATSNKGYSVVLGVPQTASTEFLNKVKTEFVKIDQMGEVVIIQCDEQEAEKELLHGNIDMCIMQAPAGEIEGISHIKWDEQELCVFISPDNPLSKKTFITPADLTNQTIIAANLNCGISQRISDYQQQNGELPPHFSGDRLTRYSALRMLSSDKIAVLPRIEEPETFYRQMSMTPMMNQDLILAWNSNIPRTSIQTKLFNLIRKLRFFEKTEPSAEDFFPQP